MKIKNQTFYKSLNFNKLIVIDAIPDDEQQTALHLVNYLHDNQIRSGVDHIKTGSADEFREIIFKLIDSFNLDMGFRPVIHIEAHGSATSLEFPDKTTIMWTEIAESLRFINEKMNNTLITFIATCHAVHYLFSNNTTQKFAPAYLCIAPKGIITPHDIEKATFPFYLTLFKSGNSNLACKQLNLNEIYYYDSDFIFHITFLKMINISHRGKGYSARKEALISDTVSSIPEIWGKMDQRQRPEFLRKCRKFIHEKLKNKESIKYYFDHYSNNFLGYAREDVFEEIYIDFTSGSQKPQGF
jgi:hypothetical protein